MSSFFSSDGSTTIQFAIIFLVIFAVLAVAVFVFRRMAGRGQLLAAKGGGRGRQPRLGIVDIYELDRQRQLILLRRDNVEHLLLVGGPNDVVIERNISRGVGARLAEEEAPRSDAEPALDPARIQPAFEPSFAMPVQVAPPVQTAPPISDSLPGSAPGATARPDSVARSLDLVAPDLFAPDDNEPQAARAPEPRPAFDDSPEPTVSPAAAPASRPPRRMPPSLTNLVPGAAKRARATDEASVAAEVEPPSLHGTSRPVDPAILSDMARQLEQAVRRPLASVIPVRQPVAEAPSELVAATAVAAVPDPAPSEPSPVPLEPAAAEPSPAPSPRAESDAVDPMAAAMATTAETRDRDDALFEPSAPEPDRHIAAVDRSIPAVDRSIVSADGTGPVAPEPVPVAPRPDVAIPETDAPKPEPTPAKPAAGPAATPFSVEEIEAEFARLLGRSLDKKS